MEKRILKRPIAWLLALLLLSLLFAGCVHYIPREDAGTDGGGESENTDSGTLAENVTTSVEAPSVGESETPESEPDTEFPNEPESDITKRY